MARRAIIAAAVLICAQLLPCSAYDEARPFGRTVATRGATVELRVRPLCHLAADDPDSRAREAEFISRLGKSIVQSISNIEIPSHLRVWQGELKVIEHPARSEPGGASVRVIKSAMSLDVPIMSALLQADASSLPNFRGRCTFEILIRGVRRE